MKYQNEICYQEVIYDAYFDNDNDIKNFNQLAKLTELDDVIGNYQKLNLKKIGVVHGRWSMEGVQGVVHGRGSMLSTLPSGSAFVASTYSKFQIRARLRHVKRLACLTSIQ